jgi:hypothetical protein
VDFVRINKEAHGQTSPRARTPTGSAIWRTLTPGRAWARQRRFGMKGFRVLWRNVNRTPQVAQQLAHTAKIVDRPSRRTWGSVPTRRKSWPL